ncbi:MAG: hypothetical protein DRQ88_01535 [Epsilonproteobacteria bacterium]|nr:MAG: hypothetical protein DRQ89_03095 [Campylobacterota bacterium]RLA67759.1 MAG: hypothetical protein DRQ88_01535 [Campylobacterota bacterium]
MALIKDISKKEKEFHKNPLITWFVANEGQDDFPFKMAVNSLTRLEDSVKNEEELANFLLEDIIIFSLNATFYEQVMSATHDTPETLDELITDFKKNERIREKEVSIQALNHINYILNEGFCQGCDTCKFHPDVAELIGPWGAGNIDFFLNLYVGMQTINYALNDLLLKEMPRRPELSPFLTHENILSLRKFIIDYIETRI